MGDQERRVAVSDLAERVASLEKCVIKLVAKDELALEKMEGIIKTQEKVLERLEKYEELFFGNLGTPGMVTEVATVKQKVSWLALATGAIVATIAQSPEKVKDFFHNLF